MKTKKYFIVPVLALLAAGCQDDMEGGTSTQLATGEEVTFGATLGESATTRTIYGSYDEDNEEYPIYWVNGDQVIVTSPDCASNGGVGLATYSVLAGEQQNYATSLTKTGNVGVQWGTNETGTFYSVYPAENASFGSDYTTVTLTMPQQQDCDIASDNTVSPYMDACFMYAKTKDVENGQTVELKYIPISTAIRFTLRGPESGNDVTVQNIRFIAPDDIAIRGEFEVDLSDESVDGATAPTLKAKTTANNNYVSINATYGNNQYLTLGVGDKATMNVFLLLEDEVEVNGDWSIVIQAYNGTTVTTFTKTLSLEGNDNKLVPGKVHNLPELPYLNFESESTEWDTSNWMTNLPRNVYLSEISIPGSWNSMNPSFQKDITAEGTTITGTSIDDQYNAGARAFHIDTRWQGQYLGLGSLIGYYYNMGDLGVADNGDNANGDEGRVMTSRDNPTFAEVLSDIADHVKPDEYMVVYCTFAQDSYDYNRSSGGWEKAISDACANNGTVIDAKDLDENSVVADVLGKVIVIVNTDNTISSSTFGDSKCLFMKGMGMELAQQTYTNSSYTVTTLDYGSGESCVTTYGTHAQVTSNSTSGFNTTDRGYAPTLSERETKAGNILSWSQENHQRVDYAHDTWLYLGLGGYISNRSGAASGDDPYDTVAEELNGWIDGKIEDMGNTNYYPVGIVLMNNVLEYGSTMVNILELNNIYRKAYDENRSEYDGSYGDGSGTTTTSLSSVASGYSSGMKDNNTNAIGWD